MLVSSIMDIVSCVETMNNNLNMVLCGFSVWTNFSIRKDQIALFD